LIQCLLILDGGQLCSVLENNEFEHSALLGDYYPPTLINRLNIP